MCNMCLYVSSLSLVQAVYSWKQIPAILGTFKSFRLFHCISSNREIMGPNKRWAVLRNIFKNIEPFSACVFFFDYFRLVPQYDKREFIILNTLSVPASLFIITWQTQNIYTSFPFRFCILLHRDYKAALERGDIISKTQGIQRCCHKSIYDCKTTKCYSWTNYVPAGCWLPSEVFCTPSALEFFFGMRFVMK